MTYDPANELAAIQPPTRNPAEIFDPRRQQAHSTLSVAGWLRAITPAPRDKSELSLEEHGRQIAAQEGIEDNITAAWDLATKHVPKATGPSQEEHGRASAISAGIPTPDTDYFRKAIEPRPERNKPDIVQAGVAEEIPLARPPCIDINFDTL